MAVEKDLSVVQYRLSFRQADTHRVDIDVSVPTDGKSEIEFMMPVWTPGSYLIREYARQVEQLTAVDGKTNAKLSIKKKDKNHWLVDCARVDAVTLRYSLYCHEMSVRTNWVERDFAFLTGAATYITRVDMLDHPHVVRIDALPNWPKAASSLAAVDVRDPWTRRAANFDELVDSPILLGAIDIQTFEVGGAKHHLATLGGESPASQAGFNAGDEFVSFDGFRVTAEAWPELLSSYRPDDICKCWVARRGKMVELSIQLGGEPETSWKIARIAKPTDEQEKRWRSWLNLPEPEKAVEPK